MRRFRNRIFQGICVLVFAFILGIFTNIPTAGTQEVYAAGSTYYVSPTGNDANSGTETAPWKTLKKAAATLQAGDTAIFEDGVYENSQIRFTNNGAEDAPITIKARNKQKAKLLFSNLNTTSKIVLTNKQYISIFDFEMTQAVSGTTSGDVFIDMSDCSHCIIGGNSIHGAGGKAVQALKGDHITVVDNEIYDFVNFGVVLANIDRPVIAGNEIREVSTAILVPAGTRSAQIYNNRIRAIDKLMKNGIVLGGSYPPSVAYDTYGYQAYDAVAWNNTLVAEQPGLIDTAFAFIGSIDSGVYHNIIVDAKYGVSYSKGGGATTGWEPVPTSSKFYNNIFSGCTMNAILAANVPIDPAHDYNLYYNCVNAPVEPNGIYEDPLLTDPYLDWYLQEDSPAAGTGTALSVNGFYGEVMDVYLDYNGNVRTEPVHMGIYANTVPKVGEILFTEHFENGDGAWTEQMGTMRIVEETPGGNHVFTDPNASSSSGISRSYAGSMDWVSYQMDTRVKFIEFYNPSGWLTLYTRYTDINNYYLVEIRPEKGYIGLKKKVAGIVTPLQEKDWDPTIGEWVEIRFVVNGADIQVYVNGKLELIGSDGQLKNGVIAAAVYQSNIQIDDIRAAKIDAPAGSDDPGPSTVPGATYYVSPTGSDMNPGTEDKPWKTMARAAQLVQRGNTVIFEDGVYIETSPTVFVQSGTANERIIFKARNKHKAVIRFHDLPSKKVVLTGISYITLQDFELTQNQRGTTTADIFIQVLEGSNHVHVIGNKIHNAFEEGVKGYLVSDYLVDGNIIYDMGHEGIDFVNVHSSIIRNNEIYDVGRVGLLAKGGSSDVEVYNNYLHNHYVNMAEGAIYMGGSTGYAWTLDSSENGYEAWNMVAYNNVIVADTLNGVPAINNGIGFVGTKDSAAYNNIVIGTRNGVFLYSPRSTQPHVGWDWDPDNLNPVFMNNIIMNTTDHAVIAAGTKQPVNLMHDYNLYSNNMSLPAVQEPNGVYADPYFANMLEGNWHLKEGSPAISAGKVIPAFVLKNGQSIDISSDYDGSPRGAVWDLGIYKNGTHAPTERPKTTMEIAGQQGENDWYVGNVAVALHAQNGESPVAVTKYTMSVVEHVYGSVSPVTDEYMEYVAPILLAEGVYDLTYRSIDILGNEEEEQNARIRIDQTAPSLDLFLNDSPLDEVMMLEAGEPYRIEAVAADGMSRVAQIGIVVNGIRYEGGSAVLTATPGIVTVVATVKDIAGNATEKSMSFSVIVSLSSMKNQVDQAYNMGAIDQSLLARLKNSLEQSKHHMDKFLQHLDQANLQTDMKSMLEQQAEIIIGNS